MQTKITNIDKFENFIKDKERSSLLINQVSEEIGLFYFQLSKYLLNRKSINFIEIAKLNMSSSFDLFNHETILYTFTNRTNDISKLLSETNKIIIFTDYKNYKKFFDIHLCVNGYDFFKDISLLSKKYFNEDMSLDLFDYLKNEPHMTFSELFKNEINNNFNAHNSSNNYNITDLIGENRKNIFKFKKEQKFKEVFSLIKEEIKIKKFSFLIS